MSPRLLLLVPLVGAALWAQSAAETSDGEAHGDPPYLRETGWTPLLNGKDLSGWTGQEGKPHQWYTSPYVAWDRVDGPDLLKGKPGPGGTILNGPAGKTANLVTTGKYGDCELWVEFMMAKGSNSGVYLQGLYEASIFDSWGAKEPLRTQDSGAIYHRWIDNKPVGGRVPRVNVARAPGEWQTFHIWFRAPRFDASGRKVENARFLRVLYNGVSVVEDVEVDGGTRAHVPNLPEAPLNPIMLQGDHGPVAFRNLWIHALRPIAKR